MIEAIVKGPLYLESHRDVLASFEQWVVNYESDGNGRISDQKPDGERIRDYLASLGQHGLLEILANEDSEHKVNIRTVGLARLALAKYRDLADFSLSIQGLTVLALSLAQFTSFPNALKPSLLSGTTLGAFAITEEKSGSDISKITTAAQKVEGGYLLNGRKSWISNAGIADEYIVFATQNAAMGALGICAFVVPANKISSVEQVDIISNRPFGTIELNDVYVEDARYIAGPGYGYKMALSVLTAYRLAVAYAAIGFSLRAYELALEHAKTRKIGDKAIIDYDQVRQMLVDISIDIEIMFAQTSHAGYEFDSNVGNIERSSSIAKYMCTERAQLAVDKSMQIFGAKGLVAGSEIEQLYRQVRLLRIYEGTSEIQRMIIGKALS